MTYEQFIEQQGGEQQFNMMMMMQTREMLVQGYALDALFRHEKLVLTDEDIEAACRSMSPQQNPRAGARSDGGDRPRLRLARGGRTPEGEPLAGGPRHRERGGPSGGPGGSAASPQRRRPGEDVGEGRLGSRRRGRSEAWAVATPPCGEIACEAARLMRAASAFPDF